MFVLHNKIVDVKGRMSKDFEINYPGLSKHCLELKIIQIELIQNCYVFRLLHIPGMEHCQPIEMRVSIKMMKYYRQIITNAVSRAAFPSISTKCYWHTAKEILRYLAGTAKTYVWL